MSLSYEIMFRINVYLDIKNGGIVKAIPNFFPYLRNHNILNPYKHYCMKGGLEIHKNEILMEGYKKYFCTQMFRMLYYTI